MAYHSTFALNLSRHKISLGIINSTKKQEILDSFDPNEPAGNQSLKRLFLLAKALSQSDPIVEVFLPSDVIQSETFISENNPTHDEVRSVLAERNSLPTSDIQVTLGENVGSRAISIAFTETSVMEELTDFITKAGFSIKCFRAEKNIVGFKENDKFFPTYNSRKINKFQNYFNLKYTAVAVGILSCFFLFLNFQTNFYRDWTIAKSSSPTINSNLKLSKLDDNLIEMGSPNTRLKNFNFPAINPQNKGLSLTEKLSLNVLAVNPPKKEFTPDFSKHFPPTIVHKTDVWFREYNIEPNHIGLAKFNDSKIIRTDTEKNLKLYQPVLEISNLVQPIDVDHLMSPNPKASNQETSQPTEISILQSETSVNYTRKPVSKQTNAKEEYKINKNAEIILEIPEKKSVPTEIKAIAPELEPMAMEYASKFSPYKKPSVIDSIRILSEPTLSTGALVFLEFPLLRPNVIIQSKKIKPTDVNISARATKSPSIPKEISVWHNSTKTNFIDLDRTNLIGIFGKTSNPSALVRLSNGKILTLKVGERFEGWRVFAIDRDKIHVENGTRQEILHLPG
ncbi:MAG: hypothetical protein P8L82_08910 [Paracoccaceae bacterium]|nr:hypothetical protein [Paracoccaceae bacterium]